MHLVEVRVGLPVIVSCKKLVLTGTALHYHTKPLQFRVWSGRLSTHSDHCSGWRLTGATAAADRTISFRQVAPRRKLD